MMPNCRVLLATAVILLGGPSAVVAGSTLDDYVINVNGTTYCSPVTSVTGCSSNGGFSAVPGLVSSGFNASTGQGTLILSYKPGAAGTYSIGAWIWDWASIPSYNEYGTVNGSAAAGQSWQIDIPDYESDSNHTGTIIANTKAGTLDNTNHIPGISDDYLLECTTGSNCNDDTSMAMGFKFTLKAGQTEIITLNLGSTNPGGFSLEQIHPVDGNNTTASDLFLSGIATLCTTPSCAVTPTIPEPASWSLAVLGLGAVLFGLRRRFSKS